MRRRPNKLLRPSSVRWLWFAQAAVALAGCGSGCDGERKKPVEQPRPPNGSGAGSATDAGPPGAPGAPDRSSASVGFLDAPPGALDPLFRSLDAAERRDPNGRALLVFFG